MTQQTDDDGAQIEILRTQIERGALSFILSPERWAECNLPVTLKWRPVQFTEANAQRIPAKAGGVYCFVLRPSMTGPPDHSYLMYVGKTNLLERRYQEYLGYRTSPRARLHIQAMLNKLDTFLWFYYTRLKEESLRTTVEDILRRSCLPPMNIDFPGHMNAAMRLWRTLGSFR